MEDLEIIEIVRATDNGATEPYQCLLSDNNLYAVKGRRALPEGLIAESIAADLGRCINLCIPEFRYCNFPPHQVQGFLNQTAINTLGKGKCFASKWIEPSQIFNFSMINSDRDILLAKIYVFDHWIKNGDRSLTRDGGNVNLLLSLRDKKLVVFDHNLAFSNTHEIDHMDLHVGKPSWDKVKFLPDFQMKLKQEMICAHSKIDQFWEKVPEDWMAGVPDIQEKIYNALYRVNEDNFWNELGQ